MGAELVAKRLELLREIVPAATLVSVLVNPTGPNAETLRDVEAAARALGLQIQVLKARPAARLMRLSQLL
jgi:putative ABC transport system substrate-binding protein